MALTGSVVVSLLLRKKKEHIETRCRFVLSAVERSTKITLNQGSMLALSVATSCSPADPSTSTRPPGQRSLRPPKKTVCLSMRRDQEHTRCAVGSVGMDWAMSL